MASASSLPRSPHPMKTTTSTSAHLTICWSSIVLPVPNPPGTAAVAPWAMGKKRSTTRWPVTRGAKGRSRSRTGRGQRTGHSSQRFTARPATVATTSSSPVAPGPASQVRAPCTSGGTSTRCTKPLPVVTVPSVAPGESTVPTSIDAGANGHEAPDGCSASAPGVSQVGASARGLRSPSKTPPRRPGPSRADSGRRLETATSPTRRPPVYSKASAVSSPSRMETTSAGMRRGPTSTTSSAATPDRPATSTSGPFTRTTRPVAAPTLMTTARRSRRPWTAALAL